MVILMPVKRRHWRKSLLIGSALIVAILLIVSSGVSFLSNKRTKWFEWNRIARQLSDKLIEPAKLEDADLLDLTISNHLQICSTSHSSIPHILTNSTHPYHTLVTTGVKAMRTFVPKLFDQSFSNPCWFASQPNLPSDMHSSFTEYKACMPNVEERYTSSEAVHIVNTALNTHPECTNVRVVDMNDRVFPPQCMGERKLAKCVCEHNVYCLPQVMLAGFPKCATTSLYYMMVKHPDIARSRTKESHFWRDTFITKTTTYKQVQMLYYIYHFERADFDIVHNASHLMIDGSTTTLFPGLYTEIHTDEDVCVLPRMMTELIPGVKFLVMMRNPADRLYSDYWYLCSKFYWKEGRKLTVPEDYLRNGTQLFHDASLKMINDFKSCSNKKPIFECVRLAGVGYAGDVACKGPRLGLSLYYYHIIRWLNILPRENMLFLRTEDFLANPRVAMDTVVKFLGLSPMESDIPLSYKNINTWIKSTEYKKKFIMPSRTRKMLDEFFKPYNKLVSRLLDNDKYMWMDIEYD